MKKAADDMNEAINDTINDTFRGVKNEEFEIAKKAVLDAYTNFMEAKRHLKTAAYAAGLEFKESGKEHLDDALLRVRERKDELRDNTSEYIRENPITSTSIAFISGVLFSRMFGK
jgi:ElaB/YqjD/DUF883 family membrane-anchored ribosome-binding protein